MRRGLDGQDSGRFWLRNNHGPITFPLSVSLPTWKVGDYKVSESCLGTQESGFQSAESSDLSTPRRSQRPLPWAPESLKTQPRTWGLSCICIQARLTPALPSSPKQGKAPWRESTPHVKGFSGDVWEESGDNRPSCFPGNNGAPSPCSPPVLHLTQREPEAPRGTGHPKHLNRWLSTTWVLEPPRRRDLHPRAVTPAPAQPVRRLWEP